MESQYIGRDPDIGKDWGQEEKGATKDEMVGWHHWLNGHEFEQALGDGEGQGGLACCSPWGHKESDTTEWLSNNNLEEVTFEIDFLLLLLFLFLQLVHSMHLFFHFYIIIGHLLLSKHCAKHNCNVGHILITLFHLSYLNKPMNNRLVPNRKRSMSRLYIVTLLI